MLDLKSELQRHVGGAFVDALIMHPRNCLLVAQVVERLPAPLRGLQVRLFRKMLDYDRTNYDRIGVPGGSVLRRKGEPK